MNTIIFIAVLSLLVTYVKGVELCSLLGCNSSKGMTQSVSEEKFISELLGKLRKFIIFPLRANSALIDDY